MTKTEMEDAIKNCNRQLSAIEHILPTLATNEALRAGLAGLKTELLVRIEALDDKFDLLADGFASHASKIEKIEKIERIVESHDVKLDALIAGFSSHDATLHSHGTKLDAIGVAVKTLTERLERKGVV